VKKALAEIWNAEDKDHAQAAANVVAADYGTKWPKAAAKITDDLDVLLAFYDHRAEHWIHLRTTNPIESTFATVRLRPAPRAPAPAPPVSRSRSSSSNQHTPGGGPSTHATSSALVRAGPRRRGIHERQAHRTTRRIRGW